MLLGKMGCFFKWQNKLLPKSRWSADPNSTAQLNQFSPNISP